MKHSTLKQALMVAAILCLCAGCSSKKVAQSPDAKSAYVMPCSEMVSGNGVLRAWAMGKSDSEMTARKKAQTAASAELAAMLTRTVQSTTEDYTTVLTEGTTESKSFLADKTKITVDKTISGASVVCERWSHDKKSGQYTNYLVLELRGEDYLKQLYQELSEEQGGEINRELLQTLFLKHLDEVGANQ